MFSALGSAISVRTWLEIKGTLKRINEEDLMKGLSTVKVKVKGTNMG